MPFGLERMSVTMHPFGMALVIKQLSKDAKWLNVSRLYSTSTPAVFLFLLFTNLYLAYLLSFFFFGRDVISTYVPITYWYFIRDINILLFIPNYIRHSSLAIMSNCSHYYGDIPDKSVFYQNQILDHWTLYPFQLFCFNFGNKNKLLLYSIYITNHSMYSYVFRCYTYSTSLCP
jgi:hypothetical protein